MDDQTDGAEYLDLDLDLRDDVHALAAAAVAPGARVLDLGCGAGRLASLLTGRGCTVVGVDIDRQALELAAAHCEAVIVADIQSPADRALVDIEPVDVVCLLDLLEHLHQPEEVLRWAIKLLVPDGVVLVSLPNVTHAAVKLQLMAGKFPYTASGLLDRTHVHLYDRAGAESLLLEAGLQVVERLRVRRAPDATEIVVDLSAFPPEVVAEATRDGDALTYQFLFVAAPSVSAQTLTGLAAQIQGRLERAEDALGAATAYAHHLEAELAAKEGRLEVLEAEVGRRDADVLLRAAELAERDDQLAAAEAQLTQLAEEHRLALADLDRLRRYQEWASELERLLAATRGRAGYRLAERIHTGLGAVPGAQPIGRWVARRLAGR